MILGIGTDIVDISRFDRFVAENNILLIERLFTPDEREYCNGKKWRGQHFALRFAAKEAFVKALGTGLRDGMAWRQIEVVNDHQGKPDLRVSGRAAEILAAHGATRMHLSLSHDSNCAVAMVVLEKTP